MTNSNELKKLLKEEMKIKYEIGSAPIWTKVVEKKRFEQLERRLSIIQYSIELITSEEEFYKDEIDFFANLKSKEEIESERSDTYKSVYSLLKRLFNNESNSSYDYNIEISSMYRFPKMTEKSTYYKFHLTIFENGEDNKTVVMDNFYLTKEDINRLGEELNIDYLKDFNTPENEFTDYVRFNSHINDSLLSTKHL